MQELVITYKGMIAKRCVSVFNATSMLWRTLMESDKPGLMIELTSMQVGLPGTLSILVGHTVDPTSHRMGKLAKT